MKPNSQPDTSVEQVNLILHKLWLDFYENSTLTSMSDTYYIADLEAKQAIQAHIDQAVLQARIEELDWLKMIGSITNHCDSQEYQIENIEVADRIAELTTKATGGGNDGKNIR